MTCDRRRQPATTTTVDLAGTTAPVTDEIRAMGPPKDGQTERGALERGGAFGVSTTKVVVPLFPARHTRRPGRPCKLDGHEQELLELDAAGTTSREIAAKMTRKHDGLDVSHTTVRRKLDQIKAPAPATPSLRSRRPGGRPRKLAGHEQELLELEAAGLSHREIAVQMTRKHEGLDVSHAAVKRMLDHIRATAQSAAPAPPESVPTTGGNAEQRRGPAATTGVDRPTIVVKVSNDPRDNERGVADRAIAALAAQSRVSAAPFYARGSRLVRMLNDDDDGAPAIGL